MPHFLRGRAKDAPDHLSTKYIMFGNQLGMVFLVHASKGSAPLSVQGCPPQILPNPTKWFAVDGAVSNSWAWRQLPLCHTANGKSTGHRLHPPGRGSGNPRLTQAAPAPAVGVPPGPANAGGAPGGLPRGAPPSGCVRRCPHSCTHSCSCSAAPALPSRHLAPL